MPALRELQSAFAAALLDPARAGHAPGVIAGGISPALRIEVYRTSLLENYRNALAAAYPAVQGVVGPGCFRQLAREYVRRYASRSGDVGAHAAWFPDFLARHPVGRDLPYLEDVARLEWAIEECFYESDPVHLDVAALARVAEEHYPALRFVLAPSARLLHSPFPVHRIWEMSLPGADAGARLELGDAGAQLLVRRDGYAVKVEALGPAEFALLDALRSGYAIGEAMGYVSAIDPAYEVSAFLRQRIADSVLCGFVVPAELQAP